MPGSATRGVATRPVRWPRRSDIPSPNGNSRLSFVEKYKQGGNIISCQSETPNKNTCFLSLSHYKTITSYTKMKKFWMCFMLRKCHCVNGTDISHYMPVLQVCPPIPMLMHVYYYKRLVSIIPKSFRQLLWGRLPKLIVNCSKIKCLALGVIQYVNEEENNLMRRQGTTFFLPVSMHHS